MITALLSAYSKLGRSISRKKFLNLGQVLAKNGSLSRRKHQPRRAYTLGTIQMFVFGGGGLQLLMPSDRRVVRRLAEQATDSCSEALQLEERLGGKGDLPDARSQRSPQWPRWPWIRGSAPREPWPEGSANAEDSCRPP